MPCPCSPCPCSLRSELGAGPGGPAWSEGDAMAAGGADEGDDGLCVGAAEEIAGAVWLRTGSGVIAGVAADVGADVGAGKDGDAGWVV